MDDDIARTMADWLSLADGFVLGRRTYEIFAATWPLVTDPDDPLGGPLNALPKYVASRTLTELSWNGARLLGEDVVADVVELKRRPGHELQISGSGELVQTLIGHGLIDEYRLLTCPVVLGKGKRLFAEGARPSAMKVVDRTSTSTGVGIDIYAPAGTPSFGEYGPDFEQEEARS
jgi:dihydrofolate reductase